MIGFVKQVVDFKFSGEGYLVPKEILSHNKVIHKVRIKPIPPGKVIT